MQIMKAFNETIDYIDRVLDARPEAREIARLSGYSDALFSRIFSMLTGCTLSEYIRFRRLTQAAADLRETDEKVIDLALKYGYESPDAFSAAFKTFHGHTPTEVRNGAGFRVFSKVQLTLSIQGGRTMDISIQKKPAFALAGIRAENIESADCPQVWRDLFERAPHSRLAALGSGQSYGMCYEVQPDDETGQIDRINYMAGYAVTDRAAAQALGLTVVDVAAAEYAVVRLKGPVPDCIHAGWRYVLSVFCPEQGYRHSGQPDFEVYGEGDMDSPDYEMALWVPVVKG